MELEEAVEQLNSLINTMNKNKKINVILFKEDKQAIETILTALKCKDELIEDLQMQAKGLNGIIRNSVSRKKIEEILEDYQERKRYYEDENIERDNDYFNIEEAIEVLQKILRK